MEFETFQDWIKHIYADHVAPRLGQNRQGCSACVKVVERLHASQGLEGEQALTAFVNDLRMR
jgi:hypothetical protein